jgi:hypothetical protein
MGIDKEARNVLEASDRRIVGDAVRVVEIKTDTEAVRVRNGESDGKEREKYIGEFSSGGKSDGHSASWNPMRFNACRPKESDNSKSAPDPLYTNSIVSLKEKI